MQLSFEDHLKTLLTEENIISLQNEIEDLKKDLAAIIVSEKLYEFDYKHSDNCIIRQMTYYYYPYCTCGLIKFKVTLSKLDRKYLF